MLISDLFVQGLYQEDLNARVPNGLIAIAATDPALCVRVLETLFFAECFDPGSRFAALPAAELKAGCVFVDDAGVSHRLMRDLKSNAAQLARAEGGQYAPLAGDAAEVAAILRTQLRFPEREVWNTLFVIRAEDFSAGPETITLASLAPSVATKPPKTRPPGQIRAEIERLKAAQRQHNDVQTLKLELDGLQKKRYAYDEMAGKRRVLADKVETLTHALAASAALAALPPETEESLRDFPRVRAKYEEERNKLAEAQREHSGPPPAPDPLLKDPRFWGGIAGGLVLLAIAARLDGDWRLIGLLDIAPFGLAAMQAFSFVEALETHERLLRRHKNSERRAEARERRYESRTALVRDALKQHGAASADELLEAMARRNNQLQLLGSAQAALAAFDADGHDTLSPQALAALDTRISMVEARLEDVATCGGDTPDPRIAALEFELALAEVERTPVPAPVLGAAPKAPFFLLLRALAECTGSTEATLAAQMTPRLGAYAEGLLGGKEPLVLQEDGELAYAGKSLGQYETPTRDVLRMAVRLCAYERCSARVAFPLVLERLDTVASLSHAALTTYYKHLTKRAQVLWIASTALDQADQRIDIA